MLESLTIPLDVEQLNVRFPFPGISGAVFFPMEFKFVDFSTAILPFGIRILPALVDFTDRPSTRPNHYQ